MQEVFAAVNLTGLAGGVTTIVVGLIAVTLILVGYRWARRALGR
ncbi:MAG: hypothetical protein DDT22_00775 [candidate division WS2 bacterium]|nr:hypothetical protein [Candidatus Lithacetigena glycinireducens]